MEGDGTSPNRMLLLAPGVTTIAFMAEASAPTLPITTYPIASLSPRLLLGHAMDRAQSPDQIAAMDAHYLAVGEDVCKNAECHAIVGVVECRDKHNSIGYIKVRIAGGQTLSAKRDGTRHGQLDHAQSAAVLVGRIAKPRQIF